MSQEDFRCREFQFSLSGHSADTEAMASTHSSALRARARSRGADVIVTLVAMALIAAPFLTATHAASNSPLVQAQVDVDQRVRAAAMISQPQDSDFHVATTGRSTGVVGWDIWTSSPDGYKLDVTSDQVPAMQDGRSSTTVGDLGIDLGPWSVGANDRRFGFSARGDQALNRFDNGTSWRGLTGTRGIEVARHTGGSVALTRTWVRLAAEMGSALPSGAHPTAHVTATAVPNL